MTVIHLNTDHGTQPDRAEGATVQVRAMRAAFAELGEEVVAVDKYEQVQVREALEVALPLGGGGLLYERFALHSYTGSDFARERGLAHVLEVNAPLDEQAARLRSDRHRAVDEVRLQSALAAARLVLCASRPVAEWARARGAASQRIRIEPKGVDPGRFHPLLREEGRRRAGVPADAFVLGFHGRLRPCFCLERLAAAAARLLEASVPVHLLLVGRGDFESVVGDVLPSGRWTHLPWVEQVELPALVAAFDVLALTYSPEAPCHSTPLKLQEALASGVPAVVPDLGDLADCVEGGRAGLVYDVQCTGGLEQALLEVHENPIATRERSRRGRELAESRSWWAIAERVLHDVRTTRRRVLQ